MSKRAKVVLVEPRIVNGVQRTYDMNGKTYYEFVVEMDNGDKGRASAMSDKFRFAPGADVFYEHVPDEKNGDRLKSFAAVEQAPANQGAPQHTSASPAPQQRQERYKEDPDKSRKIIAQSCLSSAVAYTQYIPEDLRSSDLTLALALKFEQWIHDSATRHPSGV